MTAKVQGSFEVADSPVSVSSTDRSGTVDGADPLQPTAQRLARGTSLALAEEFVAVAGIQPSNPLITGGPHCPGWR